MSFGALSGVTFEHDEVTMNACVTQALCELGQLGAAECRVRVPVMLTRGNSCRSATIALTMEPAWCGDVLWYATYGATHISDLEDLTYKDYDLDNMCMFDARTGRPAYRVVWPAEAVQRPGEYLRHHAVVALRGDVVVPECLYHKFKEITVFH